jgi:hypothetical protein
MGSLRQCATQDVFRGSETGAQRGPSPPLASESLWERAGVREEAIPSSAIHGLAWR